MFCPKCGNQLEDTATFCTACGAKMEDFQTTAESVPEEAPVTEETPVASEPAAPKKPPFWETITLPKIPAWAKPVAIACAAFIVAASVFLMIVTNSKTTVKAALGGIDDAFADNEIIGSLFTAMEEFQFSVDVQQIYGPDGQGALPSPMKYDIYSDGMQASAYFDFMGAKFDVHGLMDPLTYVIGVESGSYGLVFENLKESFRSSVFHPDSGSKYALEMNEEALELFEQLLDCYEKLLTTESMEELNDYCSDYAELFIDLMWEYGETEAETIDGNKVVTLKMDEKTLAKVLKDFISEFTSDEDLVAFLDERIPVSMLASTTGSTWIESWGDLMDELKESSDDMVDMIKSADFKLEFIVTASPIAHDLKALDVNFTADDVSMKAGIAFDGNNITISAGSGSAKFVMALEETEDGWTMYAKMAGEKLFEVEYVETEEGWKFAVEAMGETVADAEFETKDEKYEFNFAVYDFSMGYDDYYGEDYGSSDAPVFAILCEGNYTEEKGGFSMTIDELSMTMDGWTETVTMDAWFAYYTEFDMPEIPQYTDLLKADEEAIDEMIAVFEEFITGAFGGMMGEAVPDYGYAY